MNKKLNMREYIGKLKTQIDADVSKYQQYLDNATPEQKAKFKAELDKYGYSDFLGD